MSTQIITTGASFQAPSPLMPNSIPPTEWSLSYGNEIYTFDAWLRLRHSNELTITQHPVQSGAEITDHAYVNQKRFSFDIGVTDTIVKNNFASNPTRSINAYNTIQALQARRQPLTLVSKYGVYENILIESFEAADDFQTNTTLKATVNLVEILIADVQTATRSANPHATDITNRGQVPAIPEYGSIASIKLKLQGLFPFLKF